MRFAIIINAGDPRVMTDLAAEAELAGWDGVFTYDAINIGTEDTYDPWVVLAGHGDAHLARQAWCLRLRADAAATVEAGARGDDAGPPLSGRLVLPVGLGTTDDRGLGGVGEVTDTRRAQPSWTRRSPSSPGCGRGAIAIKGDHYQMGEMTFKPRPLQLPRIPIWVVGAWPGRGRWTVRCAGMASSRRSPMPPHTAKSLAMWRTIVRPTPPYHPSRSSRTAGPRPTGRSQERWCVPSRKPARRGGWRPTGRGERRLGEAPHRRRAASAMMDATSSAPATWPTRPPDPSPDVGPRSDPSASPDASPASAP